MFAALITKAASTPTTTVNASGLMQLGTPEFLASLGPASAGATLLTRGMLFKFDQGGGFLVPSLVSASSGASFVAEGAAIPVRQFAFSNLLLVRKSLKAVSVFNREVFLHSMPSIELTVRTVSQKTLDCTRHSSLRHQCWQHDAASGAEIQHCRDRCWHKRHARRRGNANQRSCGHRRKQSAGPVRESGAGQHDARRQPTIAV
jgi:hypothetical protein